MTICCGAALYRRQFAEVGLTADCRSAAD